MLPRFLFSESLFLKNINNFDAFPIPAIIFNNLFLLIILMLIVENLEKHFEISLR